MNEGERERERERAWTGNGGQSKLPLEKLLKELGTQFCRGQLPGLLWLLRLLIR
jgi:hypothetical protein